MNSTVKEIHMQSYLDKLKYMIFIEFIGTLGLAYKLKTIIGSSIIAYGNRDLAVQSDPPCNLEPVYENFF